MPSMRREAMIDLVFTQDSTLPHFHQCGRTMFGLNLEMGCGHLWSHSDMPTKIPKIRAIRHYCPNCFRGPFYYVLSIEEVENAHGAIK